MIGKLKDLPADLKSSIWDDLKHYSVGLFRGAQQIGSGTLIKCDDRLGILTAHHVVHRQTPPLDLSPSSSQYLTLVIMESTHSFNIPAKYFREIEIGIPVSDKDGPDLTFLEFPLVDQLGTLKAIKSFWNLDHDTNMRLATTLNDNGVWVMMGFPNECQTPQQESEDTNQINSKLISFIGFAKSDRRYESGGFDFVNIQAHFGGVDSLPSSFGGLSGGGLWKIEIVRDTNGETWKHDNPVFCGVPFYEEEKEDGNRIVRCHYARSIYEKARDIILNSSGMV